MITKYKGPRFTREQLVFMTEVALISALDRVESELPPNLSWEERTGDPAIITAYENGARDTAGLVLACLYAQLTGDGLGIGDAAGAAGLDDVMDKFVAARRARKNAKFPRCHKNAEKFVDELFADYLKEKP